MSDCRINELGIINFRSIEKELFEFRPLTIFTGKNGSGKSTVLNALFLCGTSNADLHYLFNFEYDKNLNLDLNGIEIYINGEQAVEWDYTECIFLDRTLKFDENFYYLNADRSPIESMKLIANTKLKFGTEGEFVEQYFLNNHRQKISNFNKLDIETLDYHIGFWINKILDLQFNFTAQESQQRIQCGFNSKDLKVNIDPTRIATGMNYLTKILIVGLTCKKGDVFVVENPEIHLHPRAISNLAEFFAMLARGGVQIVLETHDTRLVSKLRILIHKKELLSEDVMIYYKDSADSKFESVFINDNGFFVNDKGQRISFPQGFMDVDLEQLMEVR